MTRGLCQVYGEHNSSIRVELGWSSKSRRHEVVWPSGRRADGNTGGWPPGILKGLTLLCCPFPFSNLLLVLTCYHRQTIFIVVCEIASVFWKGDGWAGLKNHNTEKCVTVCDSRGEYGRADKWLGVLGVASCGSSFPRDNGPKGFAFGSFNYEKNSGLRVYLH